MGSHIVYRLYLPYSSCINHRRKKEKINFLDARITISKVKDNLSFNVNRKPTTTDTIIPNDSCHPHEHKLAAIRFLTNGMETYNLNITNNEKEYKTN